MKKKTIPDVFGLVVCIMLLMISVAAADGQYELSWSTIDGGGGQSSVTACWNQPLMFVDEIKFYQYHEVVPN